MGQLTVVEPNLLRRVVGVGVVAFLGEYDVEDGVRTAARLVHVGGSDGPAHTQTHTVSE